MGHQQLAGSLVEGNGDVQPQPKQHPHSAEAAQRLAWHASTDDGEGLDWACLTRIPQKANLYSDETYFREGLAAAREVFGAETRDMLHRAALLIVKPEGLASGQTGPIVDFLGAHDFRIAGVAELSIGRLQWREMWRYQLSTATLDRIAINDLIFRTPVLMLLLSSERPFEVPSAVRLSALKGPSDPALQPEGCLRRSLRQPTRMFSLFHVSDEPADFLREMAILLDPPQLKAFLARLREEQLSSPERHLLEQRIEAPSAITLDIQAAVGRIDEALNTAKSAGKTARRAFAALREGTAGAWRRLADEVAAAGIEVDPWDLALAGAALTQHDAPGRSKIIDSVDTRGWLETPGAA